MAKVKLKKNKKNIAMTGLMGSGKTTVGRHLANLLRKDFIDTDALIEDKEGMSISEIFKEKGEEYFRALEKKTIEDIFEREDIVVSLGGGAIVDDTNRKLIRQKSELIALIAEPEELHNRVKRRANRPLLKGQDQLKVLEELWHERKPSYMDSDVQIDTTEKSINAITNEIIKALDIRKPKLQEQTVDIKRDNFSYKIIYKPLERIDIADTNPGKQVLIVSQEPIAKRYLDPIKDKLAKEYKVSTMTIDDGESAKHFITYQLIIQKLLSLKFERKDTVIALGGGVVGDTVGFAASTYFRGIHYVQVPTTLLSMIDSSVGGKTAINVAEGKNLIGTFYQPHMVQIDVECLKTLPDKEYKCGLGELVKYTLLGHKYDIYLGDTFFDYIKSHAQAIVEKDHDTLCDVINHCLRIKSGIVAEDETEKGTRAHLNLGHTFGHALEEVTQYKRYSHGEAVAIGTICSCYLGEELGYFKPRYTEQVIELMQALGMDYKIPEDVNSQDMLQAFKYDKKAEDGKTRFIIPKTSIGRVDIVPDVSVDLLVKAIDRNR